MEGDCFPKEKPKKLDPKISAEYDVKNFIAAVSDDEYGGVNNLITSLENDKNGDLLAREFLKLKNIRSEDPNTRAAVAIGLTAVKITDLRILERCFERMQEMSEDEVQLPAKKANGFLEIYEEKKRSILEQRGVLERLGDIVGITVRGRG
jgi:hypothetical protein